MISINAFQKKYIVQKLRTRLGIKIDEHKKKKKARKERFIDIMVSKENLTAANGFTISRIFTAFFIILALDSNNTLLITSMFIYGMWTDWADGIAAELYDEETEFGKIFDPTADKFLIIGALWPFQNLVTWEPFGFKAPWFLLPFYFLIYFELALMVTAFIKPYINLRFNINIKTGANDWGKYKMVAECILVSFILLFGYTNPYVLLISTILITFCILGSILSLTYHWILRAK